ncbi:MAG: xylose ABC transporter ATP-binding protein [Firmicutes bacterium]|nr:xylose ABC transporter ATP-binding protein [Bacillota bacterium]
MSGSCLLEMRGISKDFPGVRALDRVDLEVREGEIHALVGENGAGKSTLIKILGGAYPAGSYEGEIFLAGQRRRFHSIHDAESAGIAVIHQELTLIKEMTIGENIFLGNEPTRRNGLVDWDRLYFESRRLMERVKLEPNVHRKVKEIGVGQQQLVEIAKALGKRAKILVLDEPTAALTEGETANLLAILRELKAQGVTCIYISHRIGEVFQIADRITVLRDGCRIGTAPVAELDERKVIRMMVGRELAELYPREPRPLGRIVLGVEDLSVEDPARPGHALLREVSFSVREGEIRGLAGLMGAGRTELVTSIFGAHPGRRMGTIRIDGRPVRITSPVEAIRHGLALVSEDRKRYGLVRQMNVMANITLASLDRLTRGSVLDQNEEIKLASACVEKLRIKTPSLETRIDTLSGGNQQKVVVGKWLLTKPRVLFLDEPTRGIDVGAKVEIYRIINDLAKGGVAVVMVSSELPEVIGISDRILVMCQGRIAGELPGAGCTQEQIMRLATGGR